MATRRSPRSRAWKPSCCWSPTSMPITTASRRSQAVRPSCVDRPGASSLRSERCWRWHPSATPLPGQSAGPTRSSRSSSTASGLPTLATLARGNCAKNKGTPSVRSTCCCAGWRRPDDRCRSSRGDRRPAPPALDRSDALPDAKDRLPRDRRAVSGPEAARANAAELVVRAGRARERRARERPIYQPGSCGALRGPPPAGFWERRIAGGRRGWR